MGNLLGWDHLFDTDDFTEERGATRLGVVDLIEILFVGCALFYADIGSDTISLVGFWRRGSSWFFGINMLGICLSSLGSTFVGVMAGGRILGALAGFFHLHVAINGAKTLWTWKKPKITSEAALLNTVLRGLELIEATLSLLPQGYSMIWNADLRPEEELQLQISVAISFASLANGLAILDRPQAQTSDHPAVKSLFSLGFVLVFSYRLCELVLSFGGLLLFQLATRPLGGFVLMSIVVLFNVAQWMAIRSAPAFPEYLKHCAGNVMGCFILVPSAFFYTGPVASRPSENCLPGAFQNRTGTFVGRTVGTAAMFSYLLVQAGGLEELLDIWREYNQSAVVMAHATLVAFFGYVALFAALSARYWTAAKLDELDQAEREAALAEGA